MNSPSHSPDPTDPLPRSLVAAMLQASEITDLPNAAIILARAGVPVFPCVPGGKQPLTQRGFHDASTDSAQVSVWWRRWPEANLALPTGAASGIDVVDVDVHPSGSGFPAFERARSAGFLEGWAWLVRTPSTGIHAYFLRTSTSEQLGEQSFVPATEQRSWQAPRAHVDFRGDGGYIVVPPSRIAQPDGTIRSYELITVAHHQTRPVDAAGLRAFLDPPRRLRAPDTLPAVGARPDRLAAWVASRPEGARNHGLFWAACRMAEDGHTNDTTMSVLGEAARSAGLSEREADTTIRSAYRSATRIRPANSSRPTQAIEPAAPRGPVGAVGL